MGNVNPGVSSLPVILATEMLGEGPNDSCVYALLPSLPS